jgi:hypothetical protein
MEGPFMHIEPIIRGEDLFKSANQKPACGGHVC